MCISSLQKPKKGIKGYKMTNYKKSKSIHLNKGKAEVMPILTKTKRQNSERPTFLLTLEIIDAILN